MKKTINILLAALSLAGVFASCSKLNEIPKFDDKDAFVAFDNAAISIDEDKGVVSIPVTIASVDPIATTVAYTVLAPDASDENAAKQGENFSLKDPSAVITFDGKDRTKNIEINIVNKEGVFTGDLNFSVKLSSAGGVNIGANDVCTVTIADRDHPLSEIFGEYTGKCDSVDGDTWGATPVVIGKNGTSLTSVKVYNITPYYANWASYPGDDNGFVANVVQDDNGNITGMNILCGSTSAVTYSGNSITIGSYDPESDTSNTSSGNISFTYSNGTFTAQSGIYVVIPNTGYLDKTWNWSITKN